jgi:hypothetical protein
MVTDAPAIGAPVGSVTVPVMEPVMPCPPAFGASVASRTSAVRRMETQLLRLDRVVIAIGISPKVFIFSPVYLFSISETPDVTVQNRSLQPSGLGKFLF